MAERPIYSRGLMGSRSQSARPALGKSAAASGATGPPAAATQLSPSRAAGPRAVPPVPMPPPSAVPSTRPVARQRPLEMSLDLFDARGTPAVALRSQRLSSRGARHATPGRASGAFGLADTADEFGGPATGGTPAGTPSRSSGSQIPITVEDGWGDLAAMMPPLERRPIGTPQSRRRR
jgi:hypothetical protein